MKLARLAVMMVPGLTLAVGLPARALADFSAAPSISVREEYNDNIFLTRSEKTGDYITTLLPGITLNYTRDPVKLALNYGLRFVWYADHPKQNETSLDQAQKASLDSTFNLLGKSLFLKVVDEYARIPVNQRRQVSVDNIFVNLTDTNNFRANPYLEFPLGSSLKARLGYTYQNIWYRDRIGDNAQNQTAEAVLTKEFSPTFSSFVSYSYLWHRPERTAPYDTSVPSLGINLQVAPKLSLSGSAGLSTYFYQDQSHRHLSSITWQAQANYEIQQGLILGGGYSESFSDSVTFGTFKNQMATASLSYDGKLPIRLAGRRTVSTFTDIDRKDVSLSANLDTSAPITPNLRALVSLGYETYEFRPGTENGDRYSTKFTLEYSYRQTALFSIGYTFNANESNVSQNGYTDNIAFAQARVNF